MRYATVRLAPDGTAMNPVEAALAAESTLTRKLLHHIRLLQDGTGTVLCELTGDAFTERERLAIRYAARMSETPADVPEELFDALREHFDDAELVELTAAVAFENYRARFNRAMAIEAQGFSEGAACAVPDPPAAG